MANCHSLFQSFNRLVKLNDDDRNKLRAARNSIRERLGKRFVEAKSNFAIIETLEFQSQGSYVMDTIIKPIDDDFDLDDGLYFIGRKSKEQRPPVASFHNVVVQSLGKPDENVLEIIDKQTCVSVKYKGGFHIDLPIYYATSYKCPELAHKKLDWIPSNPVELIAWFEAKTGSGFQESYLYERTTNFEKYRKWRDDIRHNDNQLRRLVRYVKAWADVKKKEMPCGLIMTILIADRFKENERDDIALYDTLKQLNIDLNKKFECLRPTTPKKENLFADYSESQKNYFLTALSSFYKSAEIAISNPNQKEACLKWQLHLGDRFPCYLAKNEIEGAKTYVAPAIIGDSAKSA
jgi:hypothetical protein